MKKLTIEFFHDVLCSYCFPMSYNLRKIVAENKNIEVVHRSFALISSEEDFNMMFESREVAKDSILSHWNHANEIDELHRFNIEGMKKQDFLFPISMPALYASKAAGFVGGDDAYWDVFDKLQYAFFAENKNVEDNNCIYECVKNAGVNFEEWKEYFESDVVKAAVEEDFKLVSKYNITSVPTLVINGKYKISGSYSYENILKSIDEVIDKVIG